MLPANDLGLPTRLVPVARALADRGHEVAVFNPALAPAKLIEHAGLKNLPVPARPMPNPVMDLALVGSAWDVEEILACLYGNEDYVRAATAVHVDLVRDYAPDVVVDSFGLFACLAARVLGVPLATINQASFHPASDGFLWWAGERPAGLPSAVPACNRVLAEYGMAPVDRCSDLLAGDLSLIVGTPETDPVSPAANVTHVGPIVWQRDSASLPEWVDALSHGQPLVWVYPGNPRYAGAAASTPIDSIVVIRAAIEALGKKEVQVVLSSGFQQVPAEIGQLPSNFHHATYLPGPAMAERCDLMLHHGGHSSVMTGLAAGTPAVMIPTITERVCNARRLAALGAGEVVMPATGADGEKRIDMRDFCTKIQRVLCEPSYRNAACRVAESMRQYGGAAQAADRIEEFAGSCGGR